MDENIVCMQLTGLLIKIDRASSSISYYKPDGTLLLKERKKDSRTMEAFQSYRVEQAGQTTHIQTADGVKTFVKDAVRVPDKQLYHTRMHFEWQQGEALYGLYRRLLCVWCCARLCCLIPRRDSRPTQAHGSGRKTANFPQKIQRARQRPARIFEKRC